MAMAMRHVSTTYSTHDQQLWIGSMENALFYLIISITSGLQKYPMILDISPVCTY